MTVAGAYYDIEQIEIQKHRVRDVEAQLKNLKVNHPPSCRSISKEHIGEAHVESTSTLQRELELKHEDLESRCKRLSDSLSRLTNLHPVCLDALVLIDKIMEDANSLDDQAGTVGSEAEPGDKHNGEREKA